MSKNALLGKRATIMNIGYLTPAFIRHVTSMFRPMLLIGSVCAAHIESNCHSMDSDRIEERIGSTH